MSELLWVAPTPKPKFILGKTVMTPGIANLINELGLNPDYFIWRHHSGDWSEMCDEDAQSNTEALKGGARIFSAYELNHAVFGFEKLWVITEADRSVTTILLPSEY